LRKGAGDEDRGTQYEEATVRSQKLVLGSPSMEKFSQLTENEVEYSAPWHCWPISCSIDQLVSLADGNSSWSACEPRSPGETTERVASGLPIADHGAIWPLSNPPFVTLTGCGHGEK
jgi:hypothetical protein